MHWILRSFLFHITAPTCFGNYMQSSWSIWVHSELLLCWSDWVVGHLVCNRKSYVTACCVLICWPHYWVYNCKCRSNLQHIWSLKSHNGWSVTFCAISMPRECTNWGCQYVFFIVLFMCMMVISDKRKLSHTRQRARRNTLKSNTCWGCDEHSDSDKQDPAVCKCSKFISNSCCVCSK
jgi:hypothetical protein